MIVHLVVAMITDALPFNRFTIISVASCGGVRTKVYNYRERQLCGGTLAGCAWVSLKGCHYWKWQDVSREENPRVRVIYHRAIFNEDSLVFIEDEN